MSDFEKDFSECIDTKWTTDTSVVLRYRNAFRFGTNDGEDARFKDLLLKTSIKEGARIFPLLTYKGVEIHLMDESSLMQTKTLKSIDGCVSIAKCIFGGHDKIVFESGGNTGRALTEYGVKAGLETFLFLPEENIGLLPSKVFKSKKAHLISVKEPGMVKEAAQKFTEFYGFKHVPETSWRYEASRFRGLFILEHMLEHVPFDWIVQSISAAFGPIGIYWAFEKFGKKLATVPRFMGIQQKANCPMYRAWKSGKAVRPIAVDSTAKLLTRVMYDFKPHTYGTYKDLARVLRATRGDLTTLNQSEFYRFIEQRFDGNDILDVLKKQGIRISRNLEEKTGLMALAGALKEIDKGTIPKGSRILSCLTSGVTSTDGKAKAEYKIGRLQDMLENYETKLSPREAYG